MSDEKIIREGDDGCCGCVILFFVLALLGYLGINIGTVWLYFKLFFTIR